jgi:hypothetical protein
MLATKLLEEVLHVRENFPKGGDYSLKDFKRELDKLQVYFGTVSNFALASPEYVKAKQAFSLLRFRHQSEEIQKKF